LIKAAKTPLDLERREKLRAIVNTMAGVVNQIFFPRSERGFTGKADFSSAKFHTFPSPKPWPETA
jgi:hypothetical protein